jgi:hypothetical protein
MIYTAHDVVDYLLTATNGGGQDGEHRAIRQAVANGYREVMSAKQWLWHTTMGSFTTGKLTKTASWTSGSNQITVNNNTGLVVGRRVSGAGIDQDSRIANISGTTITLTNAVTTPPATTTANWTSGSNQITVASVTGIAAGAVVSGAGIASGTTVQGISGSVITLSANTTAAGSGRAVQFTVAVSNQTVEFETTYLLPENVRDIDSLLTRTTGIINVYLSPVEWKQMDTVVVGNGDPLFYTVMRSDDPATSGRYMVRFLGVPTDGLEVTYSYRFQPKPLKYMGFEPPARAGTVTVSGTSVTGTNTQFPTDCANCMIRLGTSSNSPESTGGLFAYAAQQRITARGSATALTLDADPGSFTSVRYLITDVLECSDMMYTAVLAAAEMWYSRITGKPAQQAISLYSRDLRLAMEQDVVNPISGQRNSIFAKYPTPRSMGYYSPQMPDQG